MWNLNGDDVQRAKEELKGRRAAIQARYENELKQLEVDIADLETFESFAVRFVSDFKGEEGPPAKVAEPSAAADVVAEIVGEQSSAAGEDAAVTQGGEAEPAAGTERTPGQKNSSRWRMRLNTGEATP